VHTEFGFETLVSLKNLGRKTVMDIEYALSAFGYSLRRGKLFSRED